LLKAKALGGRAIAVGFKVKAKYFDLQAKTKARAKQFENQ